MSQDELTIDRIDDAGGGTTYVLRGTLDIATAPSLRARLDAAAAMGAITIDLSAVDFIDSTGLGALIGANRRAIERGEPLHLIVPEGPISRLLAITGLVRVFTVHHSREAAAAARAGGAE